MLNVVLIALVSVPEVAVSVYPVPVLLILQPAKVAMPAAAAFGFVVQARVAPFGKGGVIARATASTLVVTAFPPASWMVTLGWTAHAELPAPPVVCVVNASLAAGPTVMLKLVPV